jgi:allophanate hydrolase
VTTWIARVDERDIAADAVRLAVKDNIDVVGLPTTAGHPGFAYTPSRSATVVELLVAAGMTVAGKTNLDQFATGLVGTRSPFGACSNPHVPDRVAGGSSSGSAVAVATGEADIALGTDTAGSGRVPAALCGVVGLKPTRGLISVAGVVPASPSLDCVSVFASTVNAAVGALALAVGPTRDERDPRNRRPPRGTPVITNDALRIGIPRRADLSALDPDASRAWDRALVAIEKLGTAVEIDLAPYFSAGALVYDSFVAERYAAVGGFLARHPDGADPTVAAILANAGTLNGADIARRLDALPALRQEVSGWWSDLDTVAVPTVGEAPTLAAVAADPIGVNTRLGRYTTGANPLDLCAAAVPCGTRDDGVPFGVTFLGPAFADPVVAAAAARLAGEPDPAPPSWAGWATLVVVGAHLRGQPLNRQLVDLGGRFVRAVTTVGEYRLYALPTTPPKPGLVRVAPRDGAPIAGELWTLPVDGFGAFVAAIPPPLGVGTISLDDGTAHQGFLCETWATASAPDITVHRSWPAYLASVR